jgi:cytidine deaminase
MVSKLYQTKIEKIEKNRLSKKIAELLISAKDASKQAYAPYSTFKVGAAVLLSKGDIIHACNIENEASPSGICAEQLAVFKSLSDNKNNVITDLAIFAADISQNAIISPCGNCRQVLYEVEKKQKSAISIYMDAGEYVWYCKSASELMPLPFER